MADSAVARLRGILARDHDATTINALLADVQAEMGGVHVLGDGSTCGAEQLRATLREVRRDLAVLYASLPAGLDFYLGKIRLTRLRIDAALAAPQAEAEPHWSDPMRPVPGCAAAAAAEIYTGPGSVGDVLARAFRATWQRGR